MNMEILEKIIKTKSELDIKILYIEDNKDVRKETLELFEQFFNDIKTASDGQEGLEKFKSGTFDLVITDINMPRMNGLDMIKEIKKIDKKIPIIVITAFSDFEYLIECIKVGVYGYILKPIDLNQLIESIYRVMEKIKLRRERDNALMLLEQYKKIIDESSTVTKTDINGIITYVNDEFCKNSEYSKEELIGQPHNIVRHPDMPSSAFKNLWDTIQSKKIWHGVVKNRTKSSKSIYMKATISPILDEKGNIKEYIALRQNITDVMNPKKLLMDKIKEIKSPILLLCKIEDYDDLENLYDTKTIELIEQKFFDKAEKLFPKTCKFTYRYNLGNGEFAFLREYNQNKTINEFLRDIKQFQDNVKKTVINFDGYEYYIELILSFSTKKEHILENARMGIKKAISNRVDIVVADGLIQEMQQKAKVNIETLKIIKDAIADNRIKSYYQPIYNNKTKKIEKYESLVRLIDKNGNVLPPVKFLEVAKLGKYYKQITKIVILNTLETIKNRQMEISLNLSALDIEDKDTVDLIFEKISKNKDIAEYVVIELLENEGVHNQNEVDSFVKRIKSLGAKIAIDDFGSGYSNFSRLLEYEPDYIKIDATLIKDIATNKNSANIVEVIKNFADKQGYKTIAEFVADETIFNIVTSMGIDYSQGYYIGKPSPLEHGQ